MASHEALEGRVFLSYASEDKPFVRKLNDALEKAGFRTWLDEKDLIVGDQRAADHRTSETVW